MHVLTVIDHPNPTSFSHAVAAEFMRGAQAAGHTTELADLNAEGFSPLWSMADIESTDTPPSDVRREQERIERCDAICLVFPLFCWGMPSMMKGWMDRVFSWGWSYDQLDDPAQSLLKPRTGVLLIPAGARSDEMEEEGYTAALNTLWSKGTFGYFGLSPRKIELLNGATGSAPRRAALLERSYQTGLTLEPPC
ncbi:NAD(P)H-dependent oxidoreductase [Shimia sp. R9_1]|uniref:NAD(P)H-dependent oxidoreductase n=1 Tax=Shimia sp. R9_1 TaxID=2821111 RepID=UPI001ADC419D|nr:NAD(P)H-dependent oxidoreductase [Shimia sp. R9_1]MBO9408986.1 NAD(P)H-dependent oxidoreductase [Shimia sp. R9_1]